MGMHDAMSALPGLIMAWLVVGRPRFCSDMSGLGFNREHEKSPSDEIEVVEEYAKIHVRNISDLFVDKNLTPRNAMLTNINIRIALIVLVVFYSETIVVQSDRGRVPDRVVARNRHIWIALRIEDVLVGSKGEVGGAENAYVESHLLDWRYS